MIPLNLQLPPFPDGGKRWDPRFIQMPKNCLSQQIRVVVMRVDLNFGSWRSADWQEKADLNIKAELDRGRYKKGIKVTKEEMAGIKIKPNNFRGDWNYTIFP